MLKKAIFKKAKEKVIIVFSPTSPDPSPYFISSSYSKYLGLSLEARQTSGLTDRTKVDEAPEKNDAAENDRNLALPKLFP